MKTTGSPEPAGPARTFGRRTLARRLAVGFLLSLVAVLAALAVPLDRRLEATFLDDLTDSLATNAIAITRALPADEVGLQPAAIRLGHELGIRITVVRTDGVVLADSEHDPATMQNHSERPEIRSALAGRVGIASRVSETVGEPFRYVALRPEDDRIVRVALPLASVRDRLGRVRVLVVVAAALALALGIVASWVIARAFARPLRRMTSAAAEIGSGELERRLPVEGTAELAALASTINHMAADLSARIEEARRDRHTRDVILAAMDEGVLLISAEATVEFANVAARRLTGQVAESDPGPASGERRAFLAPVLRALVIEARGAGTVRETEIEIGRPVRTVLASAFPVGGEGLVMLVLRDVTDARRLDAVRRDFVAAASHELKTPVASIQAAAETLSHALDEDPVAARRFAAHLLRDAERLSRIVMDLLDLSRLEAERAPVEPVRLDLLAREEADRIGERIREAGLALDVTASPVTVTGSRKDLALVVTNLLDNAIRYTRPGGAVRVEVTGDNGHARLVVADTGVGIPARDLPRIFERFYRVDRARSRETGGTGLGLSIVKHVAEQHGGRVEARSELGRGSTFVVSLPASV